jgi:hypothetical protein
VVELAQRAAAAATLPTPGALGFNPDRIDGRSPVTIVNYPTWLWVDGSHWHSVRAQAAIGPERASVVAAPTEVTWQMGDGHTVTCAGPGVRWTPQAGASDCTYAYPNGSGGRLLRVTATIHWSVSWTSNVGQSGTLPTMTTSSSAPLEVDQVETVLTPTG